MFKSINSAQLKNTIVSLFLKKPNLSTTTRSVINFCFNSNHGGCARTLCSIPASSSSSEVNGGTAHNVKRKEDLLTSIPVRAYCLSHRIDLMGLMSEKQANLIPHTPGMCNYIVLRFSDLTDSLSPPAQVSSRSSYMVVFKYGSTVMFNMHAHQVDGHLKIVKKYASGILPKANKGGGDSSQHYIDCGVREKFKLPPCVQGGLNHMMLQNFKIDGICAIASIVGQSVALDYYTHVNINLEESGSNLCSFKESLNLLWSRKPDIVHWWLSDRSDVTWQEDSEYAHMFDHLADELKLTQRFADLERKFKIGMLNACSAYVEWKVPFETKFVSAVLICSALLLGSPVVTAPISALDTYLMSL
ncbi:hypothetical protein MKW94_023215 [Papaver nudicaule]|uniref:DUF155 domain-containing protein n=1 Tax=Papaver nudicaule TaxID=74823 RepID=A0AA42B0E4_PAPNU|nr:hypothetical protein [Papaver nudicaule]